MRYLPVAFFTLFAAQAHAADLMFSPKRCYSTTVETAVLDAPGEGGGAVLPKGSTVKVKAANGAGLVQIEYAASGVGSCPPPKNELRTGWIAEGSVGIYTASLPQLIKEKRVSIAGQELNAFGNQLNYLLGERVTVVRRDRDDDISGGRLKLHAEMPVTVYCPGTPPLSTSIVSASYEWGGDAESYNVKMKTKAKLPQGDCIVVNGAIATQEAPPSNAAAAAPANLCKTFHRNEYKQKDRFCAEKRGSCTENGPTVAIVKHGVMGVSSPAITWWDLYDLTEPGKSKLLGSLGSAGGP